MISIEQFEDDPYEFAKQKGYQFSKINEHKYLLEKKMKRLLINNITMKMKILNLL